MSVQSIFAIGFDLDGTIDQDPAFFAMLDKLWPGKTYVITYRVGLKEAIEDTRKFGVHKAEVILAKTMENKADIIAEKGIKIYFDDMDEVIVHIPEDVTVFKVRNDGNFGFKSGMEDYKKWVYSNFTGHNLDED